MHNYDEEILINRYWIKRNDIIYNNWQIIN